MNNIRQYFQGPEDNGYTPSYDNIRFDLISNLDFNSVLDIGSGPCKIKNWFIQNNKQIQYEAVDIRTEVQEYCNCIFYPDIDLVNGKYDLVLMLGTVTFFIGTDKEEYKNTLSYLLNKAKLLTNKYIAFTVMKDQTGFDETNVVVYSKEEIENILSTLGIFNYTIQVIEPYAIQYMVICNVI